MRKIRTLQLVTDEEVARFDAETSEARPAEPLVADAMSPTDPADAASQPPQSAQQPPASVIQFARRDRSIQTLAVAEDTEEFRIPSFLERVGERGPTITMPPKGFGSTITDRFSPSHPLNLAWGVPLIAHVVSMVPLANPRLPWLVAPMIAWLAVLACAIVRRIESRLVPMIDTLTVIQTIMAAAMASDFASRGFASPTTEELMVFASTPLMLITSLFLERNPRT
jgi:hypothetical protein